MDDVMMENAKLYKEISLDIIENIKKDNVDMIDELLEKRQHLLNEENNIHKLKKILINDGILEIDKNIQSLLSDNIDKVKYEIREHRLSKQANDSYIYSNKEKLNIFNEKV